MCSRSKGNAAPVLIQSLRFSMCCSVQTISCSSASNSTAPISCDVRKLGRRLEDVPAWTYLLNTEDGAWAAVEYEVLRFHTQNGTPLSEEQSLRDAALYGMELCPDYFGSYLVPPVTPWGATWI